MLQVSAPTAEMSICSMRVASFAASLAELSYLSAHISGWHAIYHCDRQQRIINTRDQ